MIMSNSSSTVVVCVSVEICRLVHTWISPLCVSCLRALCLTIFSHLVVIFQSNLSIHSVIDSGTQPASSLLIQSVTHTVKSRLCVFVSPVVIIFSSVLFLVGKLCHTLNFPIFSWIIFLYFHFICLQFLFTCCRHSWLTFMPFVFISFSRLSTCFAPHWCSSSPLLFLTGAVLVLTSLSLKEGGCL